MIRNIVRVIRPGRRVSYADGLQLQQQHVERVLNARQQPSSERTTSEQTLLLLEHDPVYTVGVRGGQPAPDDVQRMRRLGADLVKTNRGGLITFHGPGQLVAYPILDLNTFRAAVSNREQDSTTTTTTADDQSQRNLTVGGVKWYVAQLEAALIVACYEAGLKGARAPGHPQTGVWTSSGRKVASIGVHSRDGVTSHGAALNCCVDLAWFAHVQPCGMSASLMTSLTEELGRRVDVDEAADHFERAFQECFQCELIR